MFLNYDVKMWWDVWPSDWWLWEEQENISANTFYPEVLVFSESYPGSDDDEERAGDAREDMQAVEN